MVADEVRLIHRDALSWIIGDVSWFLRGKYDDFVKEELRFRNGHGRVAPTCRSDESADRFRISPPDRWCEIGKVQPLEETTRIWIDPGDAVGNLSYSGS